MRILLGANNVQKLFFLVLLEMLNLKVFTSLLELPLDMGVSRIAMESITDASQSVKS
jgi:hypothetical protein